MAPCRLSRNAQSARVRHSLIYQDLPLLGAALAALRASDRCFGLVPSIGALHRDHQKSNGNHGLTKSFKVGGSDGNGFSP